jgi:hypothetical protein
MTCLWLAFPCYEFLDVVQLGLLAFGASAPGGVINDLSHRRRDIYGIE